VCFYLIVLKGEKDNFIYGRLSIFYMEIPNFKTYDDGRKSVRELYSSFLELEKRGWLLDTIGYSSGVYEGKNVSLPIIALRTPKVGKAMWVLSGIHGEEPAGPNAISEPESIKYLERMGKRVPMILLPLCNPFGYLRDWRYINIRRGEKGIEGQSVGDSEHYLPDVENPNMPKSKNPACIESELLTRYVVNTSRKYLPLMSFDLHEDDLINEGYIYSQGRMGQRDPLAKNIVKILLNSGVKIKADGETRFGEPVIKGVVQIDKTKPDYSIDELLAARKIFLDGRVSYKPAAKTAIVIETPAKAMELEERKKAHMDVLFSLNNFLKK
jgi:hypothetical protein